MATFKPVVRNKRAEGRYLVYIRCTHNRKVEYIKTDMYISSKQVKGSDITDYDIIGKCANKITEWQNRLNMEDIEYWAVQDVVKFISQGNTKIPFSPFCMTYISGLSKEKRGRNASNYQTALNSFEAFLGKQLNFQDITSKKVQSWIDSLMDTRRAKEMYPVCVRAMFEAGCNEYNDYDRNIIRIANRPFKTVKIPKADTPQKRAESAETIKKLLSVEADTKRAKMAQDVARLSLYLVGINTVDLFYMEKVCEYNNLPTYDGKKLRYTRSKTRGSRSDKAYIEIAVRAEIQPLFDKYKADGDRLFEWGYSDPQSFNKYTNIGLRRLCELTGVENITTYAFRHSWATIAQNKCKASTELVAFCLNHGSAHQVTEGYIEKDFTPIDKMNDKVLNHIFGEPKK